MMASHNQNNVVRLPVRNQPSFADAAERLKHRVDAQANITSITIDDLPAETIKALAAAGRPSGKPIADCARDVLIAELNGLPLSEDGQ